MVSHCARGDQCDWERVGLSSVEGSLARLALCLGVAMVFVAPHLDLDAACPRGGEGCGHAFKDTNCVGLFLGGVDGGRRACGGPSADGASNISITVPGFVADRHGG